MSFSLFDRSFEFSELLQRQYERLREAVAILDSVFRDFVDVPAKCRRIQSLEAEGNQLYREVTRQLSLTLIRSLEREDIRSLGLALEDSLNSVKAVSTRVGLYGFTRIQEAAKDLCQNLTEMAAELAPLLQALVVRREVAEHFSKVRQVREEADSFLLVALGATYESRLETLEDALSIIKWAQIFERLENALTAVEKVAFVIEGILLRRVR